MTSAFRQFAVRAAPGGGAAVPAHPLGGLLDAFSLKMALLLKPPRCRPPIFSKTRQQSLPPLLLRRLLPKRRPLSRQPHLPSRSPMPSAMAIR